MFFSRWPIHDRGGYGTGGIGGAGAGGFGGTGGFGDSPDLSGDGDSDGGDGGYNFNPCGAFAVTIQGGVSWTDQITWTNQIISGYTCCCITGNQLFPGEFVIESPCSIQYQHSYNPVNVISNDLTFDAFLIDGFPRIDSTIEIDGVEQTDGDVFCSGQPPPPNGCKIFDSTMHPNPYIFPFSGNMTLRVFDYCKIFCGIGEPFGNNGNLCWCRTPPP